MNYETTKTKPFMKISVKILRDKNLTKSNWTYDTSYLESTICALRGK